MLFAFGETDVRDTLEIINQKVSHMLYSRKQIFVLMFYAVCMCHIRWVLLDRKKNKVG